LIVWFVINLAFSIWFLIYLFNLEKKGCSCSLTKHREYIITFIILSIIFGFANFFTSSYIKVILGILTAVIAVAYIIVTLVWIFYLKRTKCDCSKDPARTTLEVFAWFAVAVASLLAIMAAGFATVTAVVMRSTK
jgi:hypothetical protein